MKNITKLIIGIALASVVACNESWVELEPTQSIPAKEAFSSEGTLNASVVGLYRKLSNSGTGGSYNVIINDIRGEDVLLKNRNNWDRFTNVYNYNYTPSVSTANTTFFGFYDIIEGCNSIIGADEKGEVKLSDSEKNPLIAETKAMRAYCYFQLVRMFADPYQKNNGESLGVPLKVTPEVSDIVGRSKVKDAYDLILSDLNYAKENLPESPRTDRINKTFVLGLLARVYLTKGENQKAIEAAQAAIDKVPALSPDIYANGVSQDNSSIIFAINYTDKIYLFFDSYASDIDYGLMDSAGYGVIGADIDFVKNNYSKSDLRNSWFVNRWVYDNILPVGGKPTWTSIKAKLKDKAYYDRVVGKVIPRGVWDEKEGKITDEMMTEIERVMYDDTFFNIISMYGKFPPFSAVRAVGNEPTTNQGKANLGNVPIMRTPELHLIVAEAAALNNNFALAKEELLKIQNNAKATPFNGNNGDLLDAIRLERRKELIGEGFRVFDIIREGKIIDRPNYWGPKQFARINPQDPMSKIILPIPQKEIDNNPKITEADQNTAYK
ncbi:RagB/SusD family nutrient uptake outer membrane protein [Ornithobacterium rhinotracheale]|uniref:RagB/SusD family nutrient uptake outer membrane protein n=1 Tax=Ornithobacterium rhinotracheale TaxID=28251 RepID=UPI00403535D1